MTMTELQAECLCFIQFLFASELKDLAVLYKPSGIMAHIEIESDWNPNIGDDTGDGANSAGLMQLIPETARSVGVTGSQLIPPNSILSGMRYLDMCRKILGHYGKADLPHVVASYNEGPGNALKNLMDPHYWNAWSVAQKKWAYVDALPVDPKVTEAIASWEGLGKPDLSPSSAPTQQDKEPAPAAEGGQGATPPPASTEPPPSHEAQQSAPAEHDQAPNPTDQQEQDNSAEALNAQELAGGEKAVEAAVDPAVDPASNPSLNGA
jgi:hypothetical protein